MSWSGWLMANRIPVSEFRSTLNLGKCGLEVSSLEIKLPETWHLLSRGNADLMAFVAIPLRPVHLEQPTKNWRVHKHSLLHYSPWSWLDDLWSWRSRTGITILLRFPQHDSSIATCSCSFPSTLHHITCLEFRANYNLWCEQSLLDTLWSLHSTPTPWPHGMRMWPQII